MTMRILFCVMVLAALFSFPMNRAIATNGDIDIDPPAPIYEVNPGTRPGYIWSDGCWQWDGQRHRWHPGYWVAERPGFTWVPDTWEKRGQKWHYNKGHWEADEQAPVAKTEEAPVAEPVADAVPDQEAAKPAKPRCKTHCKPAAPAPSVDYHDQQVWPSYQHH